MLAAPAAGPALTPGPVLAPPQPQAVDVAMIVADVVGYGGAAILGSVFIWMLWGGRLAVEQRQDPAAKDSGTSGESPGSWLERARAWREALSIPTRLVLGLCAGFAAYHAAAYVSPSHWFGLMVPRHLWWALVLGLVAAVGLTLGTDRVVRRAIDEIPER